MQSLGRAMSGYTDLLESSADQTSLRKFLVDGEYVAVTIRIPRNLRDSAKEYAALRGMSFSALVRQSVIETLAEDFAGRTKQERTEHHG